MSNSQGPPIPSPPSSSSPDSNTTAEQPRSRRKKWAPKVKTGCVTCRVRRVKCDETKPHCKRCTAYGYVCDGYVTPTNPVPAQEKRLTRRARPAADPLEVVLERRVEPPEWEFLEACRFYVEHILPIRKRELDYDRPLNLATRHRPAFLLAMAAQRIGLISNAANILPHPEQLTSIPGLWSKFHEYMMQGIEDINTYLASSAPYFKVLALLRITDILSVEFTILGTSWRAHNAGFLALLASCKRLDLYLPPSPVLGTATQFQVVSAAVANTTSPASNPIVELDMFTPEELCKFYAVQIYGELPCPTELFSEMLRITKLRRNAISGVDYHEAVAPSLTEIFARIEAFVPETWNEPFGVPDQPEFVLMARIFKCAVALYAILSLPPPPSQSKPEDVKLWATRRLALRGELMVLMREALAILRSKAALSWPVAVAGVAVADGSDEDRELVLSTFQSADGGLVDCFYVVKNSIAKLKDFWASGKLGWEDCWNEPFPPMA
ncbi:hypothetical protein PWT90_07574 [Aphanocladium album]|nr:hypothetical protein PWT90_07574 [Aphanocladium album]